MAWSAAQLALERAQRLVANDSDSKDNRKLLATSLILNGQIAKDLGDQELANKWWSETLHILGNEVFASSDPALLDPLVRASFFLGRSDEVHVQLARLKAANYSRPAFVSALQDAGFQQLPEQ